jgi:hypothetical protein
MNKNIRIKKIAHPHFSICKKPKAQEAWSGLGERLEQASEGASNPMEGKTGVGEIIKSLDIQEKR